MNRGPSADRQVLRKTLYSGISEGSSALLFLFGVLVARSLGPTGFGEFAYALAYASVFALMVDFGLGELLSREFGRQADGASADLRAGIGLQLSLGLLFLPAALGFAALTNPESAGLSVIAAAAVATLCRTLKATLRGLLRGSGRFDAEAVSMASERVLLAGLGVAVFVGQWTIHALMLAFAVIKLLDLAAISLFVQLRVANLWPTFDGPRARSLAVKLMPFAATMSIWLFYNYTDTLMLGYFRGQAAMGEYGAIYRLFEGMVVIPSILGAVYLPLMAYEFERGDAGVSAALQQAGRFLIAASVPVVLVCALAPDEILRLVYGEAYVPAAAGLTILLAAAPFVFLFWMFRNALVAIHQTGLLVILGGGAAVFNIATNLFAIPRFGVAGACATTLVTEALAFLCALLLLGREGIRGPHWRSWIHVVPAGAVFALALIGADGAFGHALVGVPLGILLGHLVLCRLSFWTADERGQLARIHLAW